LTLLAMMMLIIGLADPHIALTQKKKGANIVLAIDTSGSMQAEDYSPNRLESAKKSAETLIDSLNPEDAIGVVTFSDGVTTAAYMSPLKEKTKEKMKAIQPKGGMTAIGDGLGLAIDMASAIPNKKKVVILLSDGVNNAGVITPDEAIAFAKSQDISVYTIGVGSEQPVLLGYDWYGSPQYAELDEATLKKIAEQTGGEYYKAVSSETLERIYATMPEKIKREEEDTSIKDWFIMAALLAIMAEVYMRYGRYRIFP
jgi:Ca-activated chloride channel homolog